MRMADTLNSKKFKEFIRNRKIFYFGPETTDSQEARAYDFSSDVFLHIRQNYNNIFITVTDDKGRVRFSVSGGFSKLRGSNRVSFRSIDIISKIVVDRLTTIKSSKFPFNNVNIFLITPPTQLVNLFLDSLTNLSFIKFFVARLKIPHNGMRSKKLRRVLYFLFRCFLGL